MPRRVEISYPEEGKILFKIPLELIPPEEPPVTSDFEFEEIPRETVAWPDLRTVLPGLKTRPIDALTFFGVNLPQGSGQGRACWDLHRKELFIDMNRSYPPSPTPFTGELGECVLAAYEAGIFTPEQ
jgi:hypothetical protein